MSDVIHLVCPHCAAVNRVPSGRLSDSPKCGKCAKSVFPGKSVAVDSTVFDKHVTRNDIPVLVDFWAPWCGPCKMMAPTFEQVAAEMEPNVRLLKVDTEQNPTLAARFGIRSIPTLAVFKVARKWRARRARWMLRRLSVGCCPLCDVHSVIWVNVEIRANVSVFSHRVN